MTLQMTHSLNVFFVVGVFQFVSCPLFHYTHFVNLFIGFDFPRKYVILFFKGHIARKSFIIVIFFFRKYVTQMFFGHYFGGWLPTSFLHSL